MINKKILNIGFDDFFFFLENYVMGVSISNYLKNDDQIILYGYRCLRVMYNYNIIRIQPM